MLATPVRTAEAPQVRPWVRYWARGVDLALANIPVALLLAWADFVEGGVAYLLLIGLTLLLHMVLNAAQLAYTGTTLGKLLLGISLRTESFERLTFAQALHREWEVALRGNALNIPLASVVANIIAYQRLSGDGRTTWDARGGYRVTHDWVGWFGGLVAVAILLVHSYLAGFLGSRLPILPFTG